MDKIKQSIKNNKVIYRLFNVLWNLLINIIIFILRIFIRINEKSIILNSFYSRNYQDSPKVISDAIKNDHYFDDYQVYWVFDNPDNFEVDDRIIKIKNNSFEFLKILLKSKFWITNSDINRFHSVIVPKGKHVYINTWHGVPFKKLGLDEKHIEPRIKKWYEKSKFDLLSASSNYDAEIMKRIFPNSESNVKVLGLPRNDQLINDNDSKKARTALGIDQEKKVILYAPTYRDYNRVSENHSNEDIKLNTDSLSDNDLKYVVDNFVILTRAHYLSTIEVNNSKLETIIRDVSDYDNLNELMIASDLLITDYSSIMFDYSLLKKSIILYTYDSDRYLNERGAYLGVKDLNLTTFQEFDHLLQYLITMDKNVEIKKTNELMDKFQEQQQGNSTKSIIQYLKN